MAATLTASTEVPTIDWDLSATKQWADGVLAEQREIYIQGPTYSRSAAGAAGSNVTTASSTMAIVGAPSEGANISLSFTRTLHLDATCTIGRGAAGSEPAYPNKASGLYVNGTVTGQGSAMDGVPTLSGIYIDQLTGTGAGGTWTYGASLYIKDAPTEGGSVTLENQYAIWSDAGINRLDDGILLMERASEPITLGAQQGYIWLKSDVPSALHFTDDADTAHDLVNDSYGEIYVTGGSTTQTTNATPGNYDIITGFNTAAGANGASNETTPDKANNKITLNKGGTWYIAFHCAFSGTNSAEIRCRAYVNGSAKTNLTFVRTLGAAGATGAASFAGFVTGVTSGQDLDVRVTSDGASDSFTPEEMNLVAQWISNT